MSVSVQYSLCWTQQAIALIYKPESRTQTDLYAGLMIITFVTWSASYT